MTHGERTRAACLADICKARFPLHEAASRYLLTSKALAECYDADWNAANDAQFEATEELRREFARVGLDKGMLQLLGVVL